MFFQLKKQIKDNLYILILFFLSSIISFKSYTTNTILSGWDTLHPEFDFGIYFQRILNVWQSHQGLGAPPSQSHVGDLPHAIILWLMSFIFPIDILRYLYILSMLFIGPLGVYFFLYDHVFKKNNHLKIYAFIGSFFYLLNLGTLQIFYTPLEMFTTLYGFIGWFFWNINDFFKNSSKKNFFKILIISLLITPSSHTATLWYVFFISFVFYLIANLFLNKFQKNLFKKSFFLILFILFINSFWLLPNIYYAKNYSTSVSSSKMHRMGTNEFFLRGQKRGTLLDLALITNFPFDWQIYDFKKNKFVNQMDEWIIHISENQLVKTWGFLLFFLFIYGAIAALIKKEKILINFLPSFILCIFFLRNANFPFTQIFLNLRKNFPFFAEIFRFPFTKFSNIYIFLYSIFLSYSIYILINLLSKKNSHIITFTLMIFLIGHLFFISPVLNTGYVSEKMRVNIPRNYFSLFSYLKQKPKQRILSLPLHNFAGWQYNNWGYQGAGFIWFGLKQPIFNRDFDRWYPYNEQAYREFSYALYSRNSSLFLNALKKYRVGYILLDESVMDTDIKNSKQMTFNHEAKILMQNIPQIKLDWQNGFLSLYKVNNHFSEVELAYNLPSISPLYHFSFEDQAYSDFGDYLSLEKDGEIFYPFRSFIDKTDKLISDIKLDLDNFYYKGNIKKFPEEKIVLPALTEDEFNFFQKGGLSIQLSQRSVYGKIPKEKIIIRPKDIEPIGKIEEKNWQRITTEEKIYYESTDKIINSSYDLLSISQQLAYAIGFKSKNINGLPLRICIKSLYSKRCEIYDELSKNKNINEDIFILPPFNQGVGYKIEILNISYGTIKTINELYEIKIIPLPYHFLKQIRIEKPQFEIKNKSIIPLNFIDFGFVKKVELKKLENIENENTTLIFNQAYEKNWKAYISETCNMKSITCKIKNFFNIFFPFIFGKEIKEHVLVNNWSNGWQLNNLNLNQSPSISNNLNIIIIFLPQYLEFLGFILLFITFIILIIHKNPCSFLIEKEES